jgi:hydroxyacylglutathione hydrolase
MKVEQIYTGCLAEAAYYIESDGEAAIIDPLRETQPYLDKLEEDDAKLRYILETHFHADFVSGHLDLSRKTGATIVYGPNAEPAFEIRQAKDGEELKLGKVTIKVLHTPGHTMESTTFLLRDEKGRDYAIFTGDTLFLGDVGRPDLAIKQGEITREDLASHLYNSLRTRIMPLGDDVIVYPGHGAGSACGKHLSQETWGYLGDQKKTNYALRADMTKEEFIREVTEGLTPPPQYFPKNAMMNKAGYESFDEVLEKGSVPLTLEQFEAIVGSEEALILDVRTEEDFAQGHIPGSVFIGLDGDFAPWVGALIMDIRQPIVLVVPEGREEEAVTRLSRVGYDNTLGYLKGGMQTWRKAGRPIGTIRSMTAEQVERMIANGDMPQILDVRKPSEYLSQHVKGAINFPLDYINNNMDKLSRYQTYALHCKSGFRSMITSSILKSRGFENLVDITGGWEALENTKVPLSDYVCPTELPQEVLDEAVAEVV